MYNCLNDLTDDLGIRSCLELPNFFLDLHRVPWTFPIVVSIGQSNECCQTNPFYVGIDKLQAIVSQDH